MQAQPKKRLPYLKRRRVEVLELAKGGGDDVFYLVWVLPEVHAKITWRTPKCRGSEYSVRI